MKSIQCTDIRLGRSLDIGLLVVAAGLVVTLVARESMATTPVVSCVSGTVSTGQTLTISGANMVDEDNTNWSSFFTSYPNASGFEGTSFSSVTRS